MVKVFIDSDGVLADFCKGASNLLKVRNPYENPNNWGTSEIIDAIKLDKQKIEDLESGPFWESLDHDFWANLEPTQEFKDGVIQLLEDWFGFNNVFVLSTPIRGHRCYSGKIAWCEKHLPRYAFERKYLLSKYKEMMANSYNQTNLLIDDSPKNIANFKYAHGNTFLVKRPWNSNTDLNYSYLSDLECFLEGNYG